MKLKELIWSDSSTWGLFIKGFVLTSRWESDREVSDFFRLRIDVQIFSWGSDIKTRKRLLNLNFKAKLNFSENYYYLFLFLLFWDLKQDPPRGCLISSSFSLSLSSKSRFPTSMLLGLAIKIRSRLIQELVRPQAQTKTLSKSNLFFFKLKIKKFKKKKKKLKKKKKKIFFFFLLEKFETFYQKNDSKERLDQIHEFYPAFLTLPEDCPTYRETVIFFRNIFFPHVFQDFEH